MKKAHVLIAGSGNITGLNVIQALKDANIWTIGCDLNEINPANELCKNIQVPPCLSNDYKKAIINIIDKFAISHIIATNDHDVRALSLMNDTLVAKKIQLNGYCENTLKCLDKEETYYMFKANGIKTPAIYTTDIQFPCVLRKKTMGEIKKFVYILNHQTELNKISEKERSNGIYTEYINGEEYTTDYICDENSNLISAIPRLRLEVRGGMVWHAKIIHDEALILLIKNIVKRLKLKGIGCIQCIKTKEGYYFIEINPRPGSGIDLSIRAGISLPKIWVEKQKYNPTIGLLQPKWNLELLRYFSGYYF